METKRKWYQSTGGIIALLILFFPVGLYLMWKHATWNKTIKLTVTGFFAFLILVNAINGDTSSSTTPNTQKSTPTASPVTEMPTQPTASPEEQTQEQTEIPEKANTPTPIQLEQPTPVSNETVSQKNAVNMAKSYLDYTAFSHDGLVDQLEYEKFSHEDAVYGADNSGGNWNEQAAKMAKSYLDLSAYSQGSLIEQLMYEKFTQEQAEYGATAVGL